MTKHIDRLMSRASVAAMAAFAPKPDPASTVPAFAERVEDTPAGGGDDGGAIDALTPEEQAQFDAAMNGRAADERDNVDPAGDNDGAPGDDEGDDDGAPADGDGNTPPADREAQPADGAQRPPPKTVSYGKYQRELKKAQDAAAALEARLDGAVKETAKEREERIKLNERTQMLLEAINTRAAPPTADPAAAAAAADPEPDVEVDPLGHLQWENRQLRAKVDRIDQGRQQELQETAAEREEREVYGNFQADLEREAQADPTFGDAFIHLRETRYRELGFIYANIDVTDAAQCRTLSPQQAKALEQKIQQSFYNEQIMTARAAVSAGRSPASVVKNLAIARGFTPKAPAAADPPPAAKPGNGAAPPAARAAPAAAPAASVTEQLDAIRANVGASRSLSDAGGSPGGDITPERLANMSEDEFQAFYDSMPKGKLDRLMGKVPQ